MQVLQRNLLVTVQAGTVAKSGKNFILPATADPDFRGCIRKLFELPRNTTHIGGRTKNDCFRIIQLLPVILLNITIFINSNQLSLSTGCHFFSHQFCMTISGIINHYDAHEMSP